MILLTLRIMECLNFFINNYLISWIIGYFIFQIKAKPNKQEENVTEKIKDELNLSKLLSAMFFWNNVERYSKRHDRSFN